jgi:DNA-binding NarL/FixJ family response regulator
MAQGKTNPQIARELVIATPTAKTHVERVIRKLGVSDRTQAAVRAVELGLVDPELL